MIPPGGSIFSLQPSFFIILILWSFRKNIGRGPLTAILFFSGTLFPALGFFNIYPMRFSFVADHFQYLASIGILLAIVTGITRLARRLTIYFSILLLLLLGYLTWKQVPVYKNPSTLWSDTVQKNPDAWMAHYNLGNIFITERKIEEAKTHFQEAIRIKPSFPLAPYNLGNALLAHGNNQEAIIHYKTVIRLKPDFVDAHNNLGAALLLEGSNREAIPHFKKALEINPDFFDALNNLEIAMGSRGDFEP